VNASAPLSRRQYGVRVHDPTAVIPGHVHHAGGTIRIFHAEEVPLVFRQVTILHHEPDDGRACFAHILSRLRHDVFAGGVLGQFVDLNIARIGRRHLHVTEQLPPAVAKERDRDFSCLVLQEAGANDEGSVGGKHDALGDRSEEAEADCLAEDG